MKDFRYIIVIILFMFASEFAGAQMTNVNDLTANQLKKFGMNAVRAGDYHTAIFFYEKYREHVPNNLKLNYGLAELHRDVRNYEKAKNLFREIAESSPKKYPKARYYYAQMLKSTGEYDEAIEEFSQFRRDYRGQKDYREYSKLARYAINGCDSAKLIMAQPLNINIEQLNSSINSPHIELSPIPINATTFMYASLRVDSLVYFTDANVDTAIPTRQFYIAKREGLDWMGGEKVSAPINIPGVETGNGVLSADGNKFYFTRCAENWQGEMICAIYLTERKDKDWTKPEKLPPIINDPNYTSSQPALGTTSKRNQEVLYFVSNRPDGRGGMDIWYSAWNEKKQLYSKPRNLGSRINTAGDEMTPFYHKAARNLYFSSNGQPGIGGLDIFSAFGERRKWTNIHNLGYPINTSYDDLYFTVSPNLEDGFLVSNRPGRFSEPDQTCCDDIYYYKWNEFVRITVTGDIYPFEQDRFGRKKDLSNFDFMNPAEHIEPLNEAIIALYMQDPETKEYVFMDRYQTKEDGKFYFNLVPDREYEFRMEGLQYFDSKNYLSTAFFTSSDTIAMPPIWVNVMTDKPIVLENIYYDFNKADLKQRAKNVLDTTLLILLKEAPEFIIEIGAHTDSIGNHEYNLELSQSRANNVVEYLITKGIPRERLFAKGYGAQKPIAPNFNPDGSDNETGREKNRRTEFRIIGTIGDIDEDDEDWGGY